MSDQAVVIWGEVLWDLFPEGPELGGAPANVAWHLGQAGGWARLVTRVGDDDDGRRAIARLEEAVDVSLVQIDRERATGVVEVRIDPADPAQPGQLHSGAGEPRYRLVPGRAWERIACTAEVREALGEAGVLVYGTLAQRTREGLDGWRAAIDAARATCLKVYDLNLRKGSGTEAEERVAVDAGIDAADVIKVNDRELAALADWRGWADPARALRGGRRVLAVTHGAAGSTLHSAAGAIDIPGVPARRTGDHVGCGDAYLAILVHGLTLGWDLAASGHAASRWAAAVAEVRGATPRFDDERIAELLGDPP